MKKYRLRIIPIISAILITLTIGFNFLIYTKLFTPFRTVLVCTIDSTNPVQTNIHAQITEHTNPDIIDAIDRTLTYSESLSNIPSLPEKPDLYIAIISPQSSTIVSDFNLWQQDDSLIIQLRPNNDYPHSIFKRVHDTTLLKTLQGL